MSAPRERILGAYRLVERVGQGGMGEVYRAQHLKLGREAAVKVLPAALANEADFLRRFEREAASAAALEHPNILPIWDYGEQEGTPYLVMPLVRGGTLKEQLERGPLPRNDLVGYLGQMAEALDYAHEQGIVHRDVKPANMLLDGRGRLYLADFGIAKALEGAEGLTRTGVGVGTPEYMAPEQAQGRADARSDLYALGIVLYQMLTGRVPYSGNSTVEVLLKHLQEPLPLLPLRSVRPPLSGGVEEVVRRALAKSPDERYQTGGALVEALSEALTRGAGVGPVGPNRAPIGGAGTGGAPTLLDSTPPPEPANSWAPTVGGGQTPWPGPQQAGGQTPPPGPQHGGQPGVVHRAAGVGATATSGTIGGRGGVKPLLIGGIIGLLALSLLCVGGVTAAVLGSRPDTAATATAGARTTATAQGRAAATATARLVAAATGTAGTVASATANAPTPTPVPPTPTTAPTATLAPTPTAAPAAAGSYTADFTTWGLGERSGQYRRSFDAATGEYRIALLKDDQYWSFFAPEERTFADFVFEVEGRRVAGPDSGGYGLFFRAQPRGAGDQASTRYIFYVTPEGSFGLDLVNPDGVVSTLLKPTASSAVRKGDTPNRLTVTCEGDQITLAVNGQTVSTYGAVILNAGEIGVYVEAPRGANGIEVAFKDLSLRPPS